jgi:hypothetical protein
MGFLREGAAAIATLGCAFVPVAAAADRSANFALAGSVTLRPVNMQKDCHLSLGPGVVIEECAQMGAYLGTPSPAGASYGWRWDLEVKDNATTGHAPETGRLLLSFGAAGTLTIDTIGTRSPVGPQTAAAARAKTRGTWKIDSGTGSFKGKKGSGTYTFNTSRTGRTTFQTAQLQLR